MKPTIVAHRGYAAKYPENTIEACQAAVDAGARWVEVDVQMQGSVPVLSHDIPAIYSCQRLNVFAEWLAQHPDVTALIDLKTESLIEYGREAVVDACMGVMRGDNWHPISFDYGALSLASCKGSPDPGWVICQFNTDIEGLARALAPRWLIMNQIFIPHETLMPPEGLPQGPWEWMSYEVATPEQARSLINRGVIWLETMDYERIRDGLAAQCSQ